MCIRYKKHAHNACGSGIHEKLLKKEKENV